MISALKGSVQVSVYQSYLVRLWQSTDQGSWQASAQSVQNGHIVLFGEIQQLLAFLQQQVNHDAETDRVAPPLSPPQDMLPSTGKTALLSNDETKQ